VTNMYFKENSFFFFSSEKLEQMINYDFIFSLKKKEKKAFPVMCVQPNSNSDGMHAVLLLGLSAWAHPGVGQCLGLLRDAAGCWVQH